MDSYGSPPRVVKSKSKTITCQNCESDVGVAKVISNSPNDPDRIFESSHTSNASVNQNRINKETYITNTTKDTKIIQ